MCCCWNWNSNTESSHDIWTQIHCGWIHSSSNCFTHSFKHDIVFILDRRGRSRTTNDRPQCLPGEVLFNCFAIINEPANKVSFLLAFAYCFTVQPTSLVRNPDLVTNLYLTGLLFLKLFCQLNIFLQLFQPGFFSRRLCILLFKHGCAQTRVALPSEQLATFWSNKERKSVRPYRSDQQRSDSLTNVRFTCVGVVALQTENCMSSG